MNCLLILDRIGYKEKEKIYKRIFSEKFDFVDLTYTRYEDAFIRAVRNWPMIGNELNHLFRWIKSLYYALTILCGKNYNYIICLNPIVGIMLGWLNFRKFHIDVCGFLFEDKSNGIYLKLRTLITKAALNRIDRMMVYGSKEVRYYGKLFSLPQKFHFVPYGIDYLNQRKYGKKLPVPFIFSGGGSNRDYQTLTEAFKDGKAGYNFVIATQIWRLKNCFEDNYELLTDVVNETFGNVLEQADLLILSLKNTKISAGHMVMLQAMSLGIPILVNDIPAIRDYVDETMVSFYESGNVSQLKVYIEKYTKDNESIQNKCKKAREKYWKDYTSEALISRLAKL